MVGFTDKQVADLRQALDIHVAGEAVPKPVTSFDHMNVHKIVAARLLEEVSWQLCHHRRVRDTHNSSRLHTGIQGANPCTNASYASHCKLQECRGVHQ